MEKTYFDRFLEVVTAAGPDCGALGEGDYLVLPPCLDYGYEVTPKNALTFCTMGVDGVHYAILTIGGRVQNDSPVIQVGPMDFSEPILVLAPNFIDYLADGCGVTADRVKKLFRLESEAPGGLVTFLANHFDLSRMLDENRLQELNNKHLHLVVPKRKDLR